MYAFGFYEKPNYSETKEVRLKNVHSTCRSVYNWQFNFEHHVCKVLIFLISNKTLMQILIMLKKSRKLRKKYTLPTQHNIQIPKFSKRSK